MFNADTCQSVYMAQLRLRTNMLLFHLVFSGDNNVGLGLSQMVTWLLNWKEEPETPPYVSSYECDMKWKTKSEH